MAILGVILITRHGDRLGFYQDPATYTPSGTVITPLGAVQEYDSGLALAQRYMNPSSAHYIQGIAWPTPNLAQLDFRADAAEGQVIVDSAYALTQGLFPANAGSSILLANGTNVTSPLNGYTYIPIETVEPDGEDYSLEGFTSCPNFASHITKTYNTTAFLAVAKDAAPFLTSVKPLVGARSTAFSNMYNIYDYMNVENIHTAGFGATENQMNQSRHYANYHEQAVFTSSTPGGIGNLPGRAILAPIMESLTAFGNSSSSLKVQYLGIAYKPFLSLFNMTQVGIDGMVDYASVLALEVTNSSGTLEISFNFRNGSSTTTDGSDIVNYPIFGTGKPTMPLSTFITNLDPYTLKNLTQWCQACNNTNSRGCASIYLANTTQTELDGLEDSLLEYVDPKATFGRQRVSPVVAGVIGAMLGIALTALFFFGAAMLQKRRTRKGKGRAAGREWRNEREASAAGDSTYELNDTKVRI